MIKPRHPLFAAPSIILTIVFLTGLAALILLNGNSIFSPGRLSAKAAPALNSGGFDSHAAFERECRRCHVPLAGDPQALCLDCHRNVASEVEQQTGLHSNITPSLVNTSTATPADTLRCAGCHPEHRGRDFDPGLAAIEHIDHSWTNFSLSKHLVDYEFALIECDACHTLGQSYTYQAEGCRACHAKHDPAYASQHSRDFGDNCLGCHDGIDSLAAFDHAASHFPLTGQHAAASCAACHGMASPVNQAARADEQLSLATFENTPTDCAACHTRPDSHVGVLDSACQDCHTPESWSTIAWNGHPFNHAVQGGFSMVLHSQDYAGQPITCLDCHTSDFQGADLNRCAACHSDQSGPEGMQRAQFMRTHLVEFGSECLACHDGVDRMSGFDHKDVFPLEGSHALQKCASCHKNQIFKGTPATCSACHAEPEIHAGAFGLSCADCHTVDAWSPAALRSHGFPLDHGEGGQAACETCHTATYTQYTCFGCHEHPLDEMVTKHAEENISLEELQACAKCHPGGTHEDSGDQDDD